MDRKYKIESNFFLVQNETLCTFTDFVLFPCRMKWSADGHDDVQWGDSYLAFLGRKFMRLVVLLLLHNIFAI